MLVVFCGSYRYLLPPLLLSFLIYSLGFEHDTLQLFKYRKMLVGAINLGVALLLGHQKTNFFEPLELPLYVTGIFLDKFSQPADMRFKVRILSVHDYYLSSDP